LIDQRLRPKVSGIGYYLIYVLSIGDWNVHLEVDWNIWLVGASWHVHEDSGDIGIYFGPMNVQIGRYDRGILQEPKPEDAVDDFWTDLGRSAAERQGGALVAAKFAEMSNLVVERERTGVPVDVYIARNIDRHSCDPRLYIPACDCPVHVRSDLQPVAISPKVRLVRGFVRSSADFRKLTQWIKLNRPTLLRYWNEQIGTDEASAASYRGRLSFASDPRHQSWWLVTMMVVQDVARPTLDQASRYSRPSKPLGFSASTLLPSLSGVCGPDFIRFGRSIRYREIDLERFLRTST
jgi:hypothetical protein